MAAPFSSTNIPHRPADVKPAGLFFRRCERMPGSILNADTGFPYLEEEHTDREKIDKIQSYLYMLLEQLRYTLGNLGTENFNDAGLAEIKDMITEPVYARLEDDEGRISQLVIDAQGLGTRVSDAEGNISMLVQTSNAMQSRISDAEGNISTLTQTSQSLSSRISSLDGTVTEIEQTVNGITLEASNGETKSTLSLMANGVELSSAVIKFTGDVVFASSLSDGTTSINGNCIDTGTIDADFIDLHGLMQIGKTRGGAAGGYLGWSTSSIDGSRAMMICDSGQDYGVVCSNNGVKMAGRGGEVVVASSKITVNPGQSAYEFYGNRLVSLDAADLGSSSYMWGSVYCDDVYIGALGKWASSLGA